MSLRPVREIIQTKSTIEGAGVKLERAFGFGKTKEFDPFLLFDDFRNDNPNDYRAGFPWHPHRGIETITYVLAGSVEHADSLGNKGKMTAGDVQWMTAGSGILHQEMPKRRHAGPHARFSTVGQSACIPQDDRPAVSGYSGRGIPEITDDDGTHVRVITRRVLGQTRDRCEGVAADPSYLDISVPAGHRKRLNVETTRTAFAYVFAGSGTFRDASDPQTGPHRVGHGTGRRAGVRRCESLPRPVRSW